jgi:hypothetical protein
MISLGDKIQQAKFHISAGNFVSDRVLKSGKT